ncbi:transcriptional repressor [Geobacter sulfurreducens]|jgi:Fe2+ or Zn2+ uptake regulation protein|uniref:Transcriptional regulator, Fur family n=1 Tax=Geobacter sulfurreducens (strain ATCC 51573 / DSM 12127 / PCA) TaxID=243231 RepID=Q748L4_GEOSL|nr:transcriptional repressor [Geobacter sulfurreducens]AAR36379.1 transcriptional regulator, Fur family [Geobacter sulfurreducens PCA]ADI85741.1 transcriptional regulator, Fur family [Geobacter sulfurreducens KN400]AJY69238.1 Fur family transcriptional regulator [Geobacter sulfurreducens]QVW34794.1 transcriptional repressor [Geobacter sulfurreducens]UAC03662.1 transcriptional repressor [Geobacter sulfurreducens]
MKHFDDLLRDLNLRITPKRRAVLDILAGEEGYASPEEVWRKLKLRFDRVGLPTVYRNLEELAAGGVITTIIHPNRQLYYYYCDRREHHHHFVCLSCRRVEEVDVCALPDLEKLVAGRVVSHIFQANGYCRECLARQQGG